MRTVMMMLLLKVARAWSVVQPGNLSTPTRRARRALRAARRAMGQTRAAASAAQRACHRNTTGGVSPHVQLALLQTPQVPASGAQASAPRATHQLLPTTARRATRHQASPFCLVIAALAIALLASLDRDRQASANRSFACRHVCVATAQQHSASCAKRVFICWTGNASSGC